MNAKEPASGSDRDREPLLAITLCSSNAPIPMPTLTDDRLRGFALFKSRRREEGRERFRLHLGYFQTVTEAERVLELVRATWPRAMIAAVPEANLGSLDNTALTRFSIVQPPAAAQDVPEPPPMVTAKVTVLPAVASPQVVAPEPPVLRTVVPQRPAEPAPAPTFAGAPRVEDAEATVVMPVVRPQPQRYAVQLAFGRTPIDLARLPDLAIYEGYLLYAIESEPGGRRLYGVRLGFYDDVLSARLVAQYVRSEFRDVTIVPVSDREVARANAARIRLQLVRATRGRSSSAPLWPKTALSVAFNPSSHLSLSA
jgi:hypothetical protein